MRTAVHPDRPLLLVGADRLVDGNELVGDRIALLPDAGGEGTAVDVVRDVHLTLMFGQRQAPRAIGQTPLPRLIVDRQPQELDERRPRRALRTILGIRVAE